MTTKQDLASVATLLREIRQKAEQVVRGLSKPDADYYMKRTQTLAETILDAAEEGIGLLKLATTQEAKKTETNSRVMKAVGVRPSGKRASQKPPGRISTRAREK
jgi:hypothetical protein